MNALITVFRSRQKSWAGQVYHLIRPDECIALHKITLDGARLLQSMQMQNGFNSSCRYHA